MTQIKAKLPLIGDYYGNPSKRFRFKGRVPTFGDLPNENGRIFNGDTYYVIDEDETYYFDEGEFKKVEIIIDGGSTSFEDLGYQLFSATETYAAGDVVIYDGSLYKFTASHSGAWIGTDAEETSMAEIIEAKKAEWGGIEGTLSEQTDLQEALDAKADKVEKRVVTELTSSIELQPNVMHVLPNVGTSLSVTLAAATDNEIVNEYMLEFDTGETPPSLSFPSAVVFPVGMVVSPNKRYQISIIDNIALYVSAQIPTA